jgi:hypothetical protein
MFLWKTCSTYKSIHGREKEGTDDIVHVSKWLFESARQNQYFSDIKRVQRQV